MKLLFFDDFKLGVLKGEAVVDVSAVVTDIPHTGPHNLISGLIERFADYRERLEQAVAQGQGVPISQVRIRPPLPNGGELHGGRHPCRASAHQCVPEVTQLRHRPGRYHGVARRPRHHL